MGGFKIGTSAFGAEDLNLNSKIYKSTLQAEAKTVSRLSQFSKGAPAGDKITQTAMQFEGLLLQQMMQSMWKSIEQSTDTQGDGMTGSREEGLYRDMLNEALSSSVSEGRGIGLREVIEKELRRREKGS